MKYQKPEVSVIAVASDAIESTGKKPAVLQDSSSGIFGSTLTAYEADE